MERQPNRFTRIFCDSLLVPALSGRACCDSFRDVEGMSSTGNCITRERPTQGPLNGNPERVARGHLRRERTNGTDREWNLKREPDDTWKA